MFSINNQLKYDRPVNIKLLYSPIIQSKCPKIGKCTHIIQDSELIYRCLTCSSNKGAIMCQNCFVEQQHDGHKWFSENVDDDANVICDCGNFQLYQPSCCCSRHNTNQVNVLDAVPHVILEKLLTEMYVIARHAQLDQLDQLVKDLISKSPVLIRLMTLALIHSTDERDPSFFFKNSVQIAQPQQSILFSFIKSENKSTKSLCNVLIADQMFRVGAMQIIASDLGSVLTQKINATLELIMIQAIAEDQLYTEGSFVDQLSEAIWVYISNIQWQKDSDTAVEKDISKLEHLNCRHLMPFWHQVLYRSTKFLPLLVKLQVLFANAFSSDPNEDMGEDGSTQETKYVTHVQMQRFFLQHKMWRGHLRLTPDVTKTLGRTVLDDNEQILTQTDHSHLTKQIGLMIDAFYESKNTQKNRNLFCALPTHICQLFILDVVDEYKLDLVAYITELHQKFRNDISLQQFVIDLIDPLISQGFWFLFVENQLEIPKNKENYAKFVGFMNRVIVNKIPWFESFYVVAQFILQFEFLIKRVETVNEQSAPIFVDFVSLLNNLPKPEYTKQFLKSIIYGYDFDAINYSILSDLSVTKYFRFDDFIEVIKENSEFQEKNDKFASKIPKFVNFDYFEPVIFGIPEIHIEKTSKLLGKPFLPKRILDSNATISSKFSTGVLISACYEVLNMYQQQKLGVGKTMTAIRILKSIGYQPQLSNPRHEQISMLLQLAVGPERKQIDMKQRLLDLKTRGVTDNVLRLEQSRPEVVISENNADVCSKCHQPLDVDFVIPIRILTSLKGDDRVHQFCVHKFHKDCAKMKQCPVCQQEGGSSFRLGKNIENAAVIYCQMRAIIEAIKYVQQDAYTRPRMIQEISKLQFLIQNSKRAFAAKTPLEEKMIEMLDKTQNQPPNEVFQIMQRMVPRIHRNILAENVFLNKTSQIIDQCIKSSCEKCGETLNIPKNPVQCISCGNFMHMSCGFEKDVFKCFVCSSTFCLHLRTMTIIHSNEQIHHAPYFNAFGQKLNFTVGDQQYLDKKLMNLLVLNLILGVNVVMSDQFLAKIGFKGDQELHQLLRRLLQ